jgi:uncharacterized protein (DUF1778 family)
MSKIVLLQIRVTEKMKNLIEKNAQQNDKTNSDYIRQLVIADSSAEDVKEMMMD